MRKSTEVISKKPRLAVVSAPERAVVREMRRPPDSMPTSGMTAKEWICTNCYKRYLFKAPVRIPVPCKRCGGISFVTPD